MASSAHERPAASGHANGDGESVEPSIKKVKRPGWTPESWKEKPIKHDPFASVDPASMRQVEQKLAVLPPLVHPNEVKKLRQLLAEVQAGKRFLIQGGDCAERFLDCEAGVIAAKLKILLQMSLVVSWAGLKPTVRVGRMAGQYAKPRSADTEVVDGERVSTFKGDCVNDFDKNNRTPDPERLLQSYFYSTATLNHIRALLDGGFADLHESKHWQLDYVMCQERRQELTEMVDHLLASLQFMDLCGVSQTDAVRTVDFFTSHEGLILPYESALTKQHKDGLHYDLSAHMLWIGDRTRQLDHAHIEFFRGVENPVGVKVGPSSKPEDVVAMCKMLDPANRPGKLVLITRMGSDKVKTLLPPIIAAVQSAHLCVVWQCDPMHGNTESTSTGLKTRPFDRVLAELLDTFEVHKACGSILGGVHFELTGEDVTECVGGPQELGEKDLHVRYTTYCDPRLNYAQSMEMAFRIAKVLREQRDPAGSPRSGQVIPQWK